MLALVTPFPLPLFAIFIIVRAVPPPCLLAALFMARMAARLCGYLHANDGDANSKFCAAAAGLYFVLTEPPRTRHILAAAPLGLLVMLVRGSVLGGRASAPRTTHHAPRTVSAV
ncbi:unnamed protein product [Ectocarpus sp. 8 AP-2014]